MKKFFTPPRRPLVYPGSTERVLARPDLRGMFRPEPSGAPLTVDERDYDDLIVHRDWRVYDADTAGDVRYFMYELSQRLPGQKLYGPVFFKAVRLIRLTRVPRYLRQSTSVSGPDMLFEQQRDLLAALREQGVLFVQLIAKSPQLPLVFSYGVQGVAATPEEAQRLADEAYAVLDFQLAGTYQQLEYKPLTFNEAEMLVRYQAEWGELAMARGRPIPSGTSIGGSMLDGNRTDVESTMNQLESFIRGMSDKSFMLSLITVPISPVEVTGPWRNLTQRLSDVRSETDGTRAVVAGVALPLSLGMAFGDTHGNTHTAGTTATTGTTDSTSQSVALQESESTTLGTSTTRSSSVTDSESFSLGQTVSRGVSLTDSTTLTDSYSRNASTTLSESNAFSQSETVGESFSTTTGQSFTNTEGGSEGVSSSASTGQSSSVSSAAGASSSETGTATVGTNNGLNAGVFGTGGSAGGSTSQSLANQQGTSNTFTQGLGTSSSSTSGVSSDRSWSSAATSSSSETAGTSRSSTVGTTQTFGRSDTLGESAGQSLARGQSVSESVTTSQSQTATRGRSVTEGIANTESQSATRGSAVTNTSGTANAVSSSRAFSDAYAVAMSRQATTASTLGAVPNVGVSFSRQTRDEAKRFLGDMLDAQMRRYGEGLKSGAFFYQMFLRTPDRETLLGAAGLLKSAFWGAAGSTDQLPQPFHVIVDLDDTEKERLITHSQAWTSYRKREPNVELIEPFMFSTYLTPTEASAFTHPPTAESIGLLAVHDSMPVMAMPFERTGREIHLGHMVNGERARVTDWSFGVDLDELTHTLIAGVTGSGKTSTLMRFLAEASRIEKTVTSAPTLDNPVLTTTSRKASILGFDWMRNMRNLAAIPELVASGRFRFYSLRNPELGEFRWNLLEIPAEGMSPMEWLNELADNFTASFNLGEFGRSLIAEYLTDLYSANRLEDFQLRAPVVDPATGELLVPAVVLPAIPRDQLPDSAITYDKNGRPIANVFTHSALSRTVSIAHLATIVAGKIEQMANPEAARMYGTAMRDRLQSLWRRIQYFAPGGQFADMLSCDPDLSERTTLSVTDLVDPDRGLVSVLETDGLDHANRRLILGSVLLAIFRYGLHNGEGVFDHDGNGPGLFCVLEEAHELFGQGNQDEDSFSASTRVALYESMFRRSRALGMRLVAVAQNPASLPAAVTSNISTVIIHKVRDDADRKAVFSLLNWSNMLSQQQREYRWLGEQPTGWAVVRLDARKNYLESAPIQILADPVSLPSVSDARLAQISAKLESALS